jgi:Tfp pilus assembly protein PilN
VTGDVNLARRPFANTRPLRRVGVMLWLVGAALAVVVGVLYWRSLFGIEGGQEKIAAIERSIADERRRLAAAEAALAGMDLRRQNVEASYLEARVRERTFPWSALFEHLAQVLPRRVRIVSLAPRAVDPRPLRRSVRTADLASRSRRPGSLATGDRVYLQMTGVAAADEALTDLLDRLFASPWFTGPSLPTERRDNGQIAFSLGVTYLPAGGRRVEQRPARPVPTPIIEEEDEASPPTADDEGEGR